MWFWCSLVLCLAGGWQLGTWLSRGLYWLLVQRAWQKARRDLREERATNRALAMMEDWEMEDILRREG